MFDPLTAKQTTRAALELVNESKADTAKAVINLVIPDNGETSVIELADATMASIKGHQSKAANLTITLGAARSLHGPMVEFTPTFALIPGTSAPAALATLATPFAIPENDTHGIP